jgi:hypothetical protein
MVNPKPGGGDMKKLKMLVFGGLCLVCLRESWASEPTVGQKIAGNEELLRVTRYGSNTCTVVSNGYVFVDGEYIPAPYTIQRIGQGVVINGILVNVLFKGDPDEVAKANTSWVAPLHGFKPDTPKVIAETNIKIVLWHLANKASVFIVRGGREMELRHTAQVWREEDFQHAVRIVISGENETKKLDDLKSLGLKGLGTDQEVKTFYERTRQSSNLIHRVKMLP